MRTTTRTAHARRAARTHRTAQRRMERGAQVRSVTVPLNTRPGRGPAALRLTGRGRLLVLLALVGLLLTAFSLGRSGSSVGATTEPASPASVAQTTVQPGESLWTVATRIAPESDPRAVMQQIRRLNDLPGSQIQAGQQLLLPA